MAGKYAAHLRNHAVKHYHLAEVAKIFGEPERIRHSVRLTGERIALV